MDRSRLSAAPASAGEPFAFRWCGTRGRFCSRGRLVFDGVAIGSTVDQISGIGNVDRSFLLNCACTFCTWLPAAMLCDGSDRTNFHIASVTPTKMRLEKLFQTSDHLSGGKPCVVRQQFKATHAEGMRRNSFVNCDVLTPKVPATRAISQFATCNWFNASATRAG